MPVSSLGGNCFIFWKKYNEMVLTISIKKVVEGLESVVLNSLIPFHLGKYVNKYCMMVVN